ncbi:MAG: response regulator [Bdellovibrionota bacterium]
MGKRILIVDDDPVIRVLIEEFLQSHGYDVSVVESGETCLSQLEKELPDLLFLDLQMPTMTGIEVLKNMRNNPKTVNVPVVMLSANDERSTLKTAFDTGAPRFLQKPFAMNDILNAIESCELV